MTDHEHADILRAIAAGEEIEWCAPDGVWRPTAADEALLHIANGYAERLRIKPKPRAPREWWVNVYDRGCDDAYSSKALADQSAHSSRLECVRVREVIPDAEAKELLGRVRGGPWLKPDGAPKQGLFLPEDVANAVDAYLERQI